VVLLPLLILFIHFASVPLFLLLDPPSLSRSPLRGADAIKA
jgi:hypothetical protein